VLDELGASKPSEWVWDTVAHILNTRYNERRATIITTNFANEPPIGTVPQKGNDSDAESEPDTELGRAARAAMRKDTLGDRIGERMRSRLQEMCVLVEIYGKDLRQEVKRARFA
jgi:DNA replication protein DnaC